MFAFFLYSILYIAALLLSTDLLAVLIIGAYLYAVTIFLSSTYVTIWYGIPLRYRSTDHAYINIMHFTIYSPRLWIVQGFGRN